MTYWRALTELISLNTLQIDFTFTEFIWEFMEYAKYFKMC